MANIIACATCSICFSSFTENCDVANLTSGHVYHKDCIDKWIEEEDMLFGSCPLCKAPIETEPTRLYLNLDRQPYLDLYQENLKLIREQSGRQRLIDTLQVEKRLSAALKSKILSLQQQNKQSNRKMEELEEKLSSLQSQKCEWQQSSTDSQSKCRSLQQQNEQLNRQTKEFEVKITSLQSEVLNLKEQIEQYDQPMKELKTTIISMHDKNCEWERSSAVSQSTIITLQQQNGELNEKLRNTKENIMAFENLNSKYTATQSQILILMQEKIDSKRRIKEKFQEKLTSEQGKRIELEKEFQEKLNSEQGKRIELELRIEDLKEQNEKKDRKIRGKNWEIGELVKQIKARAEIDAKLEETNEKIKHLEVERLCLRREKMKLMPDFHSVRPVFNQQESESRQPKESAIAIDTRVQISQSMGTRKRVALEDIGDRLRNKDNCLMKRRE